MAYVDVDIEQFEDSEVLREAINRIKSSKYIKDERLRKELEAIIKEYEPEERLKARTLDDELKIDHFQKIMNQYTLPEIETLLPEQP